MGVQLLALSVPGSGCGGFRTRACQIGAIAKCIVDHAVNAQRDFAHRISAGVARARTVDSPAIQEQMRANHVRLKASLNGFEIELF